MPDPHLSPGPAAGSAPTPVAPAGSARWQIRAVPYDLPAVREMTEALQAYYHALYRGPDRGPVDAAEFAQPGGMFFVGYEGQQPVAMGGWRLIGPLPAMPAARPAEIKRMYVASTARGRGYARAVLAHLEATAQAAGADAMVLSTGPPQRAALALYRSAGYGDVPKFGYYAAFEQAIHLGKRLPSPDAAAEADTAPGTQLG